MGTPNRTLKQKVYHEMKEVLVITVYLGWCSSFCSCINRSFLVSITSTSHPMNEFFAREFWRFVQVQQAVAKLGETAIDYPPMQDPASFNLAAVKAKIDAAIKAHAGQ